LTGRLRERYSSLTDIAPPCPRDILLERDNLALLRRESSGKVARKFQATSDRR